MLDKLKKLIFKSELPYVHKLKKIKNLRIDVYDNNFLHLNLEFVNSDVMSSIEDMKAIINNDKIYKEVIQVRMISKETISRKTFREWFTDNGYIISDPLPVFNNWIDLSIKFLKLCKEAELGDNPMLIKNYRKIKPYQNGIEIITDFILDNV